MAVYHRKTGSIPEGDKWSTRGRHAIYRRETFAVSQREKKVVF